MDRETVLKHIRFETNGFIDHNGIRVVDVDEDKSVLAAEVTDFSRNVWGNVHGGFLYTMADTAAGVFLRAKYGYRNVTLSGSISYLRSTAGAQKITAICREIKVGRSIGFLEVDLEREENILVARVQFNMYLFNGTH